MLLLVQRHKSHLSLLFISFQTKKKRQSFDWRLVAKIEFLKTSLRVIKHKSLAIVARLYLMETSLVLFDIE